MTVHYESERVTVHHGDCLDVLRELPDASVDAVVTDPPYGLGFMGREWDTPGRMVGHDNGSSGGGSNYFKRKGDVGYQPGNAAWYGHNDPRAFQAWCEQWATECLRVLKPGGHMLAFGGTRTWHRLACAIEDAGFEIRDNLAYMYGAGFPKAWNFSSQYRGDWCRCEGPHESLDDRALRVGPVCARCGGLDARYKGFSTSLKPAYEPIVLARKPLAGTVAGNVLAWGTGALNVDACRVGTGDALVRPAIFRTGNDVLGSGLGVGTQNEPPGRWPANVVLDEAAAAMLDEQSGESVSRSGGVAGGQDKYVGGTYTPIERTGHDDLGGASRFFYTAKAGSDERPRDGTTAHPTVKPLDLMRWLVRLVTPPGGTVLEPFAGSGTTVEACLLEGFRCVAVEREADYLPLILQRIHRRVDPVAHHAATRAEDDEPSLFDLFGGDAA